MGKKDGPPGSKYFYGSFENPLRGLSDSDIDRFVSDLASHHEASFAESFQELRRRLQELEPLTLLSSYSAHRLTSVAGESREWTDPEPILQHHVELLQAILLMQEPSEEARPSNPRDVIEIDELVRQVSQSFFLRRIGQLPGSDEARKARLMLIEDLRGQTQAVRNLGYANQIRRIVSDVFAPLDDVIEGVRGVRVGNLFEMHAGLEALAEERLNAHHVRLRPILHATSLREAVDLYARAVDGSQEYADEIHEFLRSERAALPSAKLMLVSHADLRVMDCFIFELADIVQAYPGEVDSAALRGVIDSLSLTWGDLADHDPEHLFLGNPVWRQPVVRLATETYFWPILSLFYSFAWDLMESLVPDDAKERYSNSRSSYLEDSVEQLLRTALPTATVLRGSYWDDPKTGKRFENDLLVQLDTSLLVVEAKSGRVTAPARRGAEQRIESEVTELLLDPSQQAQRFAQFLLDTRGKHEFDRKGGGRNEVDTRHALSAFPLTVTLDNLTAMAASNALLEVAGFVPEGEHLNLAFTLADLETVLDLLPSSAQRLHYLRRRNHLERRLQFLGDERDILALYTDTGFNLGSMEEEPSILMIPGLSGDIDRHYIGEQTGQEAPKPTRKMSDLWLSVLKAFEERAFPGWLEVSVLLLYAAYDTQRRIDTQLRRTTKAVRGRQLSPQYIVGSLGPSYDAKGVVFYVYRDVSRDERNRQAQRGLDVGLEQDHVGDALLLGFDTELPEDPYAFLAVGPKDTLGRIIPPEGQA